MKSIVRAALGFALLCIAAGTAPTQSWAGEPPLTPAVAKALSAAVKAAQSNDFTTALAGIKEAQAVSDRTLYDDYKINSILAYVAGQTKDYATATTATEAAADSPVIPDEDKKQIVHNALIYANAAKQYQKAIAYGQELATLNALDSITDEVLAESYYFTNDYAHAQQYAQASIDASKAEGKQPEQNALTIVMSAQAKQNNTGGAEQSLEQLAVAYNKPENWVQLTDLALGGKGIKDLDALFILRLFELTPGAVPAEDCTTLGSVADEQGYSTEAYKVLQGCISSGKITAAQAGQTYTHARNGAGLDEHSLKEIAASAERSKSGEQDVKLAEDYWGYGRYAEAETIARRAVSKGGLKDPTEAPTLIGILQVAQGKYADAIQTFGQINGSPSRNKTVHLWSLYAQAQQKQAQGASTATTPAPADTSAQH